MNKMTSRGLAKLAGVSQSTVSRALNDSPTVNEQTKARIRALARQHGFRLNVNAQSLKTQKTNLIGIVFMKGFIDFGVNAFLTDLYVQLRTNLAERGYESIPIYGQDKDQTELIETQVRRQRVDGILLLNMRDDPSPEVLELLHQNEVPHVGLYAAYKNEQAIPTNIVLLDYQQTIYLSIKHLVDFGHRRIAAMIGEVNMESSYRRQSFQQTIREIGLNPEDCVNIPAGYTFETGYESAKSHIEILRKQTAVIAVNDVGALGVIKALGEEGLRVPDDISVMGQNDLAYCTWLTPTLTTVRHSRTAIAEKMCGMLEDAIKQGMTRERVAVIGSTLIPRESTAPPP